MNVLSLFDGMSCGQEALKRAGIKVDNYFASEVDKYAVQIAQKNFPKTMQLGDVTKLSGVFLSDIDLLIGGSPCQGFSFAGKREGMLTECNIEITSLEQYLRLKEEGFKFKGQSYLFWEYVRVLGELRESSPDVKFLLENVKMKKENQDIISGVLGVEPIKINSALVSAQNRKRLYWTNIRGVKQPEDKGILLEDIVHEVHEFVDFEAMGEGWCEWWKKKTEYQLRKGYSTINPEKAITMVARQYANWNGNFLFEHLAEYIVPFNKTLQILDKEVQRGKVGYFRKDSQANRVYYTHDKAITLCGDAGGGAAKMGQYLFGDVSIIQRPRGNNKGGIKAKSGKVPSLTSSSYEHNNHLLFGCITPDRINKRQNGQRFSEGQKFYTLTAQDQHGILIEGYIRKLTPIECERLQTLPDNYTKIGVIHNTSEYIEKCARKGIVLEKYVEKQISNSQRYKMLGNGWTVDVIAHILKHMEVQQ